MISLTLIVPRYGGFYLLLKGQVEKLSRDTKTKEESSTMVRHEYNVADRGAVE